MLISEAFAQAGGADAGAGGGLAFFLPIILIVVVFYFLMIRPQQTKMKQKQQMLAAIRRGDRVVTNAGIIGTVTKVVDDNEIIVEIAEGLRIRVDRWLLERVVAKTQPAGESSDGGGKAAGGTPEGGEGQKSGGSTLKRLLGGKSE